MIFCPNGGFPVRALFYHCFLGIVKNNRHYDKGVL